jgi:hypothetical protein
MDERYGDFLQKGGIGADLEGEDAECSELVKQKVFAPYRMDNASL